MVRKDYTIVYSVTRNWYQYMPTVLNALFSNNDFITKVYIFAEDDVIDSISDERIEIINVNNYEDFIEETSPNKDTRFTKMSMVRCALTQYIGDDFALYLDVDTLVVRNIKELWDKDFSNNYIMIVKERFPFGMKHYRNSGVCFFNLKKIWEDMKDVEMINLLNTNPYQFPDQDAINDVFYGNMIELGNEWNSSNHTGQHSVPFIRHATGGCKFWNEHNEYHNEWKKYYTEEFKNPPRVKPNVYQRIWNSIKELLNK